MLGAQHKKRIVWRTSPQACLLCPWARHLTGRPHLYVADRWPTRTLPDYNCEVANPACGKRRLLGTHQWQSALLVMGLPVTEDWLEMGCHLFPSLISIRLTACRTSIPRKRRGTRKQTIGDTAKLYLPWRFVYGSNGIEVECEEMRGNLLFTGTKNGTSTYT